ncbi:MAG: N-6 DNA methylase [Clostridia bacterium]|nr:N-6 DNA methylase [Clostridia bacterium]
MARYVSGNESEIAFLKAFNEFCYSRSSWQVWSDLITAIACSISNAIDKIHFEKREQEYMECMERLGSVEKAAEVFNAIIMALENNPDQDFLGHMYMALDMGNHWRGQFFTPYHISKYMAKMTINDDINTEIENKGYISINDCCCGGGAMLIGAANVLKEQNINFQQKALFVAQDIDRVVALMCYIQLSLLGCPGYVCVGNSLTNPITGHLLFPNENKNEGQELWYTPMFCTDVWHYRKLSLKLKGIFESEKQLKKENFTFFFDFEKGEYRHERIV